MKEVNLANLKEAANRLLFDMSENEYKTLLKEFDTVVKQMKFIADDKTIEEYTPLIYPFPVTLDNVLREDEPSTPTQREYLLKNAKNKLAGQIKVSKVNS